MDNNDSMDLAAANNAGNSGAGRIMENEEINRRIHVEIMGECDCVFPADHEDELVRAGYICAKCGASFPKIPDYCNDLNAVAKAEAKVIAEKGKAAYMNALLDCFPANPVVTQEDLEWDCDLATAPASVRCAAMLKTREK